MRDRSSGLFRRFWTSLANFRGDRRANVAVIFALALLPTMGIFGLGLEASTWLMVKRGQQNAADSAVMAAAAAGEADHALGNSSTYGSCSSGCIAEGKGVATRFGFTDGQGNAWVNVQGSRPCPQIDSTLSTQLGGPNICYEVTIARPQQLFFTRMLGLNGNNGGTLASRTRNFGTAQNPSLIPVNNQMVGATAWAGPVGVKVPVCILALGPDPSKGNSAAIRDNGGPNEDLGDCTIFSDADATCHGHNTGAWIGGAVGTDGGSPGCGIAQFSNQANVPDPYASLASNIPANSCSKYSTGGLSKKGASVLPAVTMPAGNYTAASFATEVSTLGGAAGFAYTSVDASGDSVVEVCGDFQIAGNVNVTNGNVILVIENGQFDLNASQITTTALGAAGMTTIFQNQGASNLNSPTPWFTDATNGSASAINIAAPTSGLWSGVTIYDPAASGNYEYAGNAPAWTLSGIVYFPNVDMDWRGVVGKATNGFECFDMVVKTLLIDGTGKMFSPSLSNPGGDCGRAGVKPPTTNGYHYVLIG